VEPGGWLLGVVGAVDISDALLGGVDAHPAGLVDSLGTEEQELAHVIERSPFPAPVLEAVDVGEAEIEDDEVGTLLHDLAQGAQSGRGAQDHVPTFCQASNDGGEDVGVVLHHRDGRHRIDATARHRA